MTHFHQWKYIQSVNLKLSPGQQISRFYQGRLMMEHKSKKNCNIFHDVSIIFTRHDTVIISLLLSID